MLLSRLHIPPTDSTPEYIFEPDGIITIRGRGMILNRNGVPDPIVHWLDKYLSDPPETTVIRIDFEYLNSFSTTILAAILKKTFQVLNHRRKIAVHWYYEEDDEDILERGEYVSASLNLPFEFIKT